MKEIFVAKGGRQLHGSITVHGAKNAVLPLLAAAILTDERVSVVNCPYITDVNAMMCLLSRMGAEVTRDGRSISVRASTLVPPVDSDELCKVMRSSMFLLGALLARVGEANIPLPGGCKIGERPLDIHLDGMAKLGADVRIDGGYVHCSCKKLRGADIVLRYPSVGATENLLMCAATAQGRTRLINCAREPEIISLARALNAMGASIRGEGSSVMTIDGVSRLYGATLTPNADRIVAGTMLLATAVCGGDVTLSGAGVRDIDVLLPYISSPSLKIDADAAGVRVTCERVNIRAFSACTAPYPLLPTDMQPQLFACALKAKGISRITETVFADRFAHAYEFMKMGADISVCKNVAMVVGAERLQGADLCASDLRGGAGLCIAALAADGESRIDGVNYIDRGYERLDRMFASLGADIVRVKSKV